MEHLFTAWSSISSRLSSAAHILLVSDYDGTLTPIVQRPDEAGLSEATRLLLSALSQEERYTVAIVSGRALDDVKAHVSVEKIIYAGNHGLEVDGGGVNYINPVAKESKPILQQLNQALHTALSGINGVLIENKGLTLSVHYRLVDRDRVSEVTSIFQRIVSTPGLEGKIRTTEGKKVYEVRPAVDWDKGRAVEMLITRHASLENKGGLLPLFLGDDLTDEDGFRVVEQHRGISIFVGGEGDATTARYFLRSPKEVADFLRRLIDTSQKST